MCRVGVAVAQIAGMVVRVCDCGRISADAEKLANFITCGLFIDFVDCDGMPAAMYLKRYLSLLANRYLFRCEVVEFIGTRIRGAADCGCGLRARRRAKRRGRW